MQREVAKMRRFFVLLLFSFLFLSACGQAGQPDGFEMPPLPQISISEFVEHPEDLIVVPAAEETFPQEPIPMFNEYIVSLEYEPFSRVINGIVNVRYTNRTNDYIQELFFNVPFYRHMQISHIFLDNDELYFMQSGSGLIIDLLRPVYTEETINIHIHFDAYIPALPISTGANNYAIWGGAFLPIEVSHNMLSFTVEITTPHSYQVAGTGTKTETYFDELKVTAFSAFPTRDFAFAISPYFQRSSVMSPSGLVEINFYHYSEGLPIEHIQNVAAETFSFFEQLVGAYPYSQLCITETDLWQEALGFSALILIDSEYLRESANLYALRSQIARQWFSVIIGGETQNDAWLHDNLVQFLLNGETPLFNELLSQMGQENFTALLREYYTQFAFQIASADDFINLAEEVNGARLLLEGWNQ